MSAGFCNDDIFAMLSDMGKYFKYRFELRCDR